MSNRDHPHAIWRTTGTEPNLGSPDFHVRIGDDRLGSRQARRFEQLSPSQFRIEFAFNSKSAKLAALLMEGGTIEQAMDAVFFDSEFVTRDDATRPGQRGYERREVVMKIHCDQIRSVSFSVNASRGHRHVRRKKSASFTLHGKASDYQKWEMSQSAEIRDLLVAIANQNADQTEATLDVVFEYVSKPRYDLGPFEIYDDEEDCDGQA